jgi:hypothetical protein
VFGFGFGESEEYSRISVKFGGTRHFEKRDG